MVCGFWFCVVFVQAPRPVAHAPKAPNELCGRSAPLVQKYPNIRFFMLCHQVLAAPVEKARPFVQYSISVAPSDVPRPCSESLFAPGATTAKKSLAIGVDFVLAFCAWLFPLGDPRTSLPNRISQIREIFFFFFFFASTKKNLYALSYHFLLPSVFQNKKHIITIAPFSPAPIIVSHTILLKCPTPSNSSSPDKSIPSLLVLSPPQNEKPDPTTQNLNTISCLVCLFLSSKKKKKGRSTS